MKYKQTVHALDLNSPNSKMLAGMWDEFVNAKKRMKTEGPFLLKTLKKPSFCRVFNAALGTGVSSFFLIKNGYTVLSNELDFDYRIKALQNAQIEGVKLDSVAYDWRYLERVRSIGPFDGIICLGNSLTYLFERDEQLASLKGFWSKLRRKGVLAIDTRNYDYMLEEREAILDGGRFCYSGNYVYCGTDRVRAYPVAISDAEITMEYLHLESGNKVNLDLYPFKLQELTGLIMEAGFAAIKIFSDFKEGYDKNADFFQFVCTKV